MANNTSGSRYLYLTAAALVGLMTTIGSNLIKGDSLGNTVVGDTAGGSTSVVGDGGVALNVNGTDRLNVSSTGVTTTGTLVSNGAFTASYDAGVGGALGVTGSLSALGAETVGTTLGVTGATTLAGATCTTLGASSYVSSGSNVASTGAFRGPNASGLYGRNVANNADIVLATVDGSNQLSYGSSANSNVTITAGSGAGVYVIPFLSPGVSPGNAGDVRLANGGVISFKDVGSAAGLTLVKSDGSNQVFLGSASSSNVTITSATGTGTYVVVNATVKFSVDGTATTIANDLKHTGSKVGFYNTTPVTVPTVTGSKTTTAALASLLSALASQGLIVDSSSP